MSSPTSTLQGGPSGRNMRGHLATLQRRSSGLKSLLLTKIDHVKDRMMTKSFTMRSIADVLDPSLLGKFDGVEQFFDMPESRKAAVTILAVRKATAVAIGSTTAAIASLDYQDIKGHVHLSRQLCEFESCILGAEHAFLDKLLTEMDHTDKVYTVFELLDKSGDGVDAQGIVEALRKIKGLKTIDEVLPVAELAIELLACDGELLTIQKFDHFLSFVAKYVECSFNDIVELVVSKIVFSENGRSIMEDFVANLGNSDNQEDTEEAFDKRLIQARMLLIFDTMDYGRDGNISFKAVVKHVFRFIADSLESEKRDKLVMVDSNEDRQLKFVDFTELIISVLVAASSSQLQLQFHEIMNAITLSVCRQDVTDTDIQALFLNHHAVEDALASITEEEHELEDMLSFGKLQRLFDLLDLSKDGFLDIAEVALFLRKHQSDQVDMDETFHATIDSMVAVGHNEDKKLDRRDFTILVMRLARGAGVQVHRFVDFLLIQSALKDDKKKDMEYIATHAGLHAN